MKNERREKLNLKLSWISKKSRRKRKLNRRNRNVKNSINFRRKSYKNSLKVRRRRGKILRNNRLNFRTRKRKRLSSWRRRCRDIWRCQKNKDSRTKKSKMRFTIFIKRTTHSFSLGSSIQASTISTNTTACKTWNRSLMILPTTSNWWSFHPGSNLGITLILLLTYWRQKNMFRSSEHLSKNLCLAIKATMSMILNWKLRLIMMYLREGWLESSFCPNKSYRRQLRRRRRLLHLLKRLKTQKFS